MQVVETLATEPMPYDLYYLPWLEEVWIHAWSNSTFDVIDVSGNLEKTHKAIKAHITPGKLLPLDELSETSFSNRSCREQFNNFFKF